MPREPPVIRATLESKDSFIIWRYFLSPLRGWADQKFAIPRVAPCDKLRAGCTLAPLRGYFIFGDVIITQAENDLTQYVANAVYTYRDKAFGGVTGHADVLSLKRDPFRHESEVRLLYIDADRKFEGQPSIEVPIDVNAVIHFCFCLCGVRSFRPRYPCNLSL